MAGVKTLHPEYQLRAPQWKKCDDVAQGTDKVRAGREEYLPRLSEEDNASYDARLNRTCLYNATWRTIVGMNGLLFRRPPVATVPESVTPLLKDVTLDGVPLSLFAAKVSEQVLTTGRVGIWVNYPKLEGSMTQADVQRLSIQPSMTMYPAVSIINWNTTRINNAMVLTLVVLRECGAERVDEYETKEIEQYRVLDLVPIGDRYAYRARVIQIRFNPTTQKDEEVTIEESYPLMNGDFLSVIPFFFISPDDTTPDCDVPPLIDLVDVNIAHFRVTADWEHGCHWSGIPTLVITGHQMENKGEKIAVGGGSALVLPSPAAQANMLEAGTGGFTALEKNMERKENQMVILGARLLEIQKPGIEAAETALIHRSGEQSILESISETISTGLSRALQMFSLWAGGKGVASITINKEFFHTDIDSKMITSLVDAWQRRGMSFETLFANLKKGGVYTPDADIEEEKKNIAAGLSNIPPLPAPPLQAAA